MAKMFTEKVLVGMSGGVDSSVTALLLKDAGYEVEGVTLKLCETDDDSAVCDAKAVCQRMGLSHRTVDLRDKFSHYVIDNFVREYKVGKTPNPCIVCTKYIKFGAMLDNALDAGFDKIATGHYARVEKSSDGRFLLLKAKDISKDQSYVLYNLTQEKLSHLLLPLGELSKTEVRERALKANLVSADRPDSQDICFVPDGDYAGYIEKRENFVSPRGDYVDIFGNVLGQHEGVIRYTLGQRKGLGIALGKPQFVIDKLPLENKVVLGDEDGLFKTRVLVNDTNFIPFDKLEDKMRVTAKLRYRHNPAPAIISPLENGEVEIIFDEPQRAPSPGQAAVFYDGEIVVGGGTII